jgi:hypothetical protein
MQSGQVIELQSPGHWEMQVIGMKMDQVESFLALKYLLEQQGVIDVGIHAVSIQAQRTGGDGD